MSQFPGLASPKELLHLSREIFLYGVLETWKGTSRPSLLLKVYLKKRRGSRGICTYLGGGQLLWRAATSGL